MLLSVKTPSASSMTFFRFMPEKSSGIMGADIATTNANILTVHPASGTVTWKCSAIRGRIPITPISVLMIPKTPAVRMNTSKAPESGFNLLVCLINYMVL